MKLSKCYICKKYKPLSEFYKDRSRSNNVASRCKSCHYEYTKKRKRDRREYFRKYREKNKEKLRAKWKLQYAIRKGKISRGKCEVCGKLNAEAHHDDYSKPYDVRWLCHKHHMNNHF